MRQGIQLGRYAPGQRLRETDLVAQFKFSKAPIREAMQILAREGLIRIERHRGFVVTRLSRKDISDIYEILEPLAGVAARGAALAVAQGRSSQDLLQRLKAIKASVKSGDIVAFMETVDRWRDTLDEMGGNARLPGMMAQLRLPVFRLQLRSLIRPSELPEVLMSYERITSVVQAGDHVEAEIAVREHTRNSAQRIGALPDELFD